MAKVLAVVFLILTVCTFGTAHANIVTNGGFETGDFTGWTWDSNTGATGVNTTNVHSGTYAAYLGPVGSDGTLSQDLTTTGGQGYDLSFYLANDGGNTNDFTASWNGGSLVSMVNAAAFSYTLYDFHVTATGPTTTLLFSYRQDPAYYHLDDVSVTPTGVPEPISLVFLATGLIGLVGLRRKFGK